MRKVNLTIKEICDVVGGQTSLDPYFLVKNIASLENAGNSDLAVVFDKEDNSVFDPLPLKRVMDTGAGVILASRKIVNEKRYLVVDDPLAAIKKLDVFIDEKKYKKDTCINESAFVGEFAVIEDEVTIDQFAVIEDDAKIGFGAKIGANVFIGKGCQIGCNAVIYPGAKILDRCIVGDGSIIHSGVVIGSDGFGYRVMRSGLKKIPHVGIVRIGKGVEIGANTAIDRAEFEETVIGDGVKIDNCVHIAHNVKIGASTAILAQTGIAGSTVIGIGCQIGGQVAIKDHLKIGNYVKIVSKSAVMRNLKDGEVVCGIPTMPFSQWKRIMVAMQKLPESVKLLRAVKKQIEEQKNSNFIKRFFMRL